MNRVRNNSNYRKNGFTMIEIIAVLLIIGILAVVVAVRMMDTGQADLSSQRDVIKNHLRYAQSRAMSTDSSWGVSFPTSKTYFLFRADAPSTPVLFPGEDSTTVNLTTKKSSLTITSAPQTVTFDDRGSPGTTSITVATNGGNIVVTKNTGFIE
ncbi:MAG: type II secretion system protein [Deltaproteobacteria bacterium]|nr:type II secretion system protein [Deltaproteobacteria bacterium]